MLTIHSASVRQVDYWARSAVSTQWLGTGAERLGLQGAVGREDLVAVLEGRAPGGGPVTPRPSLRRRQGWDLVLAAPKSVSLLVGPQVPAGLEAPPGTDGAAPLIASYRAAVADTVAALEHKAAYVASGGRRVPAPHVAVAGFEHRTNHDGQPHLHTHLVLANLASPEAGGWGCIVGTELWRWREALGGGFHIALRHRAQEAGFAFAWEVYPGGLGELSDVPAAARWGASARSRQVTGEAALFGASSAGALRVAQGRTRRPVAPPPPAPVLNTGQPAAPPPWGPHRSAAVLARARGRAAGPAPEVGPGPLARALSARASRFSPEDVVVALAETTGPELGLAEALRWAGTWADGHGPLGYARTEVDRLGAHVVEMARDGKGSGLARASRLLAERELEALGTSAPAAAGAVLLACGGDAVSVVPAGRWLDQAACIDAARSVWQAAGMEVRVASPTEASSRRWEALTALRPVPGPGEPGVWGPHAPTAPPSPSDLPGRPGHRVLVVDAAGHLSPMVLERLVSAASRSATKLVLVVGGPVPGAGATMSEAVERLAGSAHPCLHNLHGAAPNAAFVSAGGPYGPLLGPPAADVAIGQAGLFGCLSGARSLGALARYGVAHPDGTVLVAPGPAEAEWLNQAVKHGRSGAAGPGRERSGGAGGVDLEGWAYGVGETVMALKRLGTVPAGTRGTVAGGSPRAVTVTWRKSGRQWETHVPAAQADRLGLGYATTLPYLRALGPDHKVALLGRPDALIPLLGRPHAVGPAAGRYGPAWLTLAGSGLPSFGPGGIEARQRAGRAQLEAAALGHDRALAPARPGEARPLGPPEAAIRARAVRSAPARGGPAVPTAPPRRGPAVPGASAGRGPAVPG